MLLLNREHHAFGDVATSEHIADHYWNSLSRFPKADLATIEKSASPMFQAKQRKLAFYLDPSTVSDRFFEELQAAGYSIEPEIWLGIKECPTSERATGEIAIQEVVPQTLEDFLRVFSQAFGGPATEKDGYGDIPPEYLTALKKSASRNKVAGGVSQSHFVGYVGSTPVGVPASISTRASQVCTMLALSR